MSTHVTCAVSHRSCTGSDKTQRILEVEKGDTCSVPRAAQNEGGGGWQHPESEGGTYRKSGEHTLRLAIRKPIQKMCFFRIWDRLIKPQHEKPLVVLQMAGISLSVRCLRGQHPAWKWTCFFIVSTVLELPLTTTWQCLSSSKYRLIHRKCNPVKCEHLLVLLSNNSVSWGHPTFGIWALEILEIFCGFGVDFCHYCSKSQSSEKRIIVFSLSSK